MELVSSDPLVWVVLVTAALLSIYWYSTRTDIPKIKGIPEIPGALPM